jgi:hypothetical protein
MAGMKIGLKIGAWASVLFAVWAAFATINVLLLVPANPGLTDNQNLAWKLGLALAAAVVSYLFFRLARFVFKKARALG